MQVIDISIAIAAACAGFAAGWFCKAALGRRQLLSRRRCSSGLRLGANQITKAEWEAMRTPPPRRVQLGELVMPRQRQHLIRAEGLCIPPETDPRFGVPWEEGTVQRGNGHGGPTTPKAQIRPTPQQPLTADLIRYWKWQDEQVRQALEDGTNNQPPGDAP